MNSLNQEVMADMDAIFNEVQSRPDIKAAVLISQVNKVVVEGEIPWLKSSLLL